VSSRQFRRWVSRRSRRVLFGGVGRRSVIQTAFGGVVGGLVGGVVGGLVSGVVVRLVGGIGGPSV
jgi:hypothetical protein